MYIYFNIKIPTIFRVQCPLISPCHCQNVRSPFTVDLKSAPLFKTATPTVAKNGVRKRIIVYESQKSKLIYFPLCSFELIFYWVVRHRLYLPYLWQHVAFQKSVATVESVIVVIGLCLCHDDLEQHRSQLYLSHCTCSLYCKSRKQNCLTYQQQHPGDFITPSSYINISYPKLTKLHIMLPRYPIYI